jgi:oligopeptide transport system substrate-binding protein
MSSKSSMKIFLNYTLILTLLLSSCSSDDSKNNNSKNNEGKGGKVYGGSFKIAQSENIHSLFPSSIVDVYTADVAKNIFETLLKFDSKNLEVKPLLVESWSVDESGTNYTFTLKKGIKFHDDPCFENGKGRELTTNDVKYSFSLLCTYSKQNRMFSSTFMDRVVGATEYFEESKKGTPSTELKGIEIIDDYTFNIRLTAPFSSFKYILTYPSLSIVPREAIEKYGEKISIGSGPFILSPDQKSIGDSKIVLIKNKNYHAFDTLGNQLPFLDSIEISVIDSKKMELEQFEKGNLHLVSGLPAESIRDIVEQQIADFQNKPPKFILDRSPQMATEYYDLNLNSPALKDKRVRQAINYAIDRNAIIDKVLKGEAYGPAENGITPPTFFDYDMNSIKGYYYDPEKAKLLFAEAGYPGGKGFPPLKLQLNSGGYKNTSVAFEVQKQLMDNLGINIDLEVVSFAQKIEDARYGRGDMFRAAWVADYPSPDNFLFLFYGKNVPNDPSQPSFPNVTRFKNSAFDELYEKGLSSTNKKESYAYFLQAESILMEEAPIIALWYNERYKLIKSNVRSYFTNPLNYSDFSEIYLKQVDKITERGQ